MEDNGDGPRSLEQCEDRGLGARNDPLGSETTELLGVRSQELGVVVVQATVEPHIAALRPAPLRQPFSHGGQLSLNGTSGFDATRQYPDPPQPPVLLGARRERPNEDTAQ